MASAGAKQNKKKKRRRKPRLEGEALRDELMNRERLEEDAVLAANTRFYRARAYKVGCSSLAVWVPVLACPEHE